MRGTTLQVVYPYRLSVQKIAFGIATDRPRRMRQKRTYRTTCRNRSRLIVRESLNGSIRGRIGRCRGTIHPQRRHADTALSPLITACAKWLVDFLPKWGPLGITRAVGDAEPHRGEAVVGRWVDSGATHPNVRFAYARRGRS